MVFRPALWMTLCASVALMLLLALGCWQLYRLQWKNELITEFEARAQGRAVDLREISATNPPRYQRVVADGVWLHEYEVQLTGRVFEGTAGYHIITPLALRDGGVVFVNRGWVSQDYRAPESRGWTLDAGQVRVEGIIRLPAKRGRFVPMNAPAKNDWFTLAVGEISRHHDLEEQVIDGFTIDALRQDDTLPIGAAVDIALPNNHWQYALTWFGIALGLVGIYVAWHVQAGRLYWKER